MLDQNTMLTGDYIHVNLVKLSASHKYIVYTIDNHGHEEYEARIKNLETSEHLVCIYTFQI